MSERAAITDIVKAYDDYVLLAEALGFRVQKSAVRRHALKGLGYRGEMKSFFSASYADHHPERTAPSRVSEAVGGLVQDLAGLMRGSLNGQAARLGKGKGYLERLAEAIKSIEDEKRRELCAAVAESTHAGFLRRRERPIGEFHKALEKYAGEQTVARGKLIEHIQEKLTERGVRMSRASIEERFRRNTKVRTVPAALIEIVGRLDDRFRTGLVGIETLVGDQPPEEWLEACREEIGFRSKNSMHRALGDVTSVNYETVHKALTKPRPGQRLQKEIVDTLLEWRNVVRRGERLPVAPQYLASSSRGEVTGLLRRLSRRSRSPKQAFREGGRALGVGPVTARKAMAGENAVEFSQRSVRSLKELVKRRETGRSSSFLTANTRKTARVLAQRAEAARDQWQAHPDNDRLERAFKRRRLELIMAIKEGYTVNDLAWERDLAADDDDALD